MRILSLAIVACLCLVATVPAPAAAAESSLSVDVYGFLIPILCIDYFIHMCIGYPGIGVWIRACSDQVAVLEWSGTTTWGPGPTGAAVLNDPVGLPIGAGECRTASGGTTGLYLNCGAAQAVLAPAGEAPLHGEDFACQTLIG